MTSNKKRLASLVIVILLLLAVSGATIFVPFGYSTAIFSDGFESGSFGQWTATTASPGCTAAVNTNLPHHGLYSAQFTVNANVGFNAYARKTIAASNTTYARFYIQWNTTAFYYDFARFYSGSTIMMQIYVYSTTSLAVKYRNGTSMITGPTVSSPMTANTWYCFEMSAYVDGVNGNYTLFKDGVNIWSLTGLNTSFYGGITQFYVGEMYNGAGNAHVTTVDCVAISDTYNGLEPSDTIPPTYSNVSTNTTLANNPCSFNCLVSDDTNVSSYIFSTNNTGIWTNDTATTFSSFFNATAGWANVTKTLNDTVSNVVSYLWYANDTYSNWGSSGIYNLTLREAPNLQITPNTVTCRKFIETFSIQINVTNAVSIRAFTFTIYYDPGILNCSSVASGELANPFTVTFDRANGIVYGNMAGSPLNGNHWLLNITFQTAEAVVWHEGLTNNLTGKIWFHQAEIMFSDNSSLQYVEGGINQINVNQVPYTFLPIQGDLNNDGTVNINDIRTVAAYYGMTPADPEWLAASKYDLNNDNTIDILDIILIATNFGFTYP